MTEKESTEKKIRNIRRQNRKKYSAEEKIRIVLEGLRGDESVAELCRREGLSQSMYYKSPKGDNNGVRNSWWLENNDWQGTRSVRPIAPK